MKNSFISITSFLIILGIIFPAKAMAEHGVTSDGQDTHNQVQLDPISQLSLTQGKPVDYNPLAGDWLKDLSLKQEDQTINKTKQPQVSPVIQAQEQVSTMVYPQSDYEQVYKDAGAKYDIPWQILYGIHLTETGLRNGDIRNYQGSGAQGPMQFMPGTWKVYGVDGDGDGIADINNAQDAIYSAANFMHKHGSIANGLRSYGGNAYGVLAAARARGFSS